MTASVSVLPLSDEARAAACNVAAAQSAADAEMGVFRERERVLSLFTIARQAARLGVEVHLATVIADGADPNEVRALVLNLATEKDQANANT